MPELENVVPTESTPAANPVAEKPVDLASRVAKFNLEKTQTVQATQPTQEVDIGFDYKEIESIQDPKAKEVAMKAYKSMQSGATKKFQEIAAARKEYESKLEQMKNWTPERIQNELLKNPEFLAAAQKIVPQQQPQAETQQGLTAEEYSMLTETEKQKLAAVPMLQEKINQLEQERFRSFVSQTDMALKAKYPDYDPAIIDREYNRLATLSPVELREQVYKLVNFDKFLQGAAEYAKEEYKQLNQNRVNSMSADGLQTVSNDGKPIRDAKDTDITWFQKLAQWRQAQHRQK